MLIFDLLAFFGSGLVTFLLYRYLLNKSLTFGLLAPPNSDVITHRQVIPLIGGVGIFTTILLILFLISIFYRFPFRTFLSGFLPVALLGLYKDRNQKPLSPFIQLIFQVFSVIVLYFYWVDVNSYTFSWFALSCFVLFAGIIINGFNFLDVMDGLAGSYTLILFCYFGVLSIYYQNNVITLVSCAFIGAMVAFLRYNWHPAKLFMGDLGSLGLIYSLLFVALSIHPFNNIKSPVIFFFVFFVPVFEFFFTCTRRILLKKLPFVGDANHASLLLLNNGYKSTTIVYYVKILTTISAFISLLYLTN